MGMSSYANHVNTVSDDIVKKVCRKEYNDFKKLLGKHGVDIDNFSSTAKYGDAFHPIIDEAYSNLVQAFSKATGLRLSINYHDPEMSESGDDICGTFWEVDGVRDYTPKAKKFLKKYGDGSITDSFFCTYG